MSSWQGRLTGKCCLVTGGGTGIGRAVALRFAEEGARVVVNGRRIEPLEEVMAAGRGITAVSGDIAQPEVARKIIAHTVSSVGGLDVLFHAAGVLRRNEDPVATTDEQWSADVAVNLTGAFNVVRAGIPALKRARGTA